jgi:berberine-like enzyme
VPQADQPIKMPWLDVTQTLNGSGANQRGKYKSAYMIEPFPEQQIEVIWNYLTDSSYNNKLALLQVDSYGGQINAVAPDATAIPQRSSIMKLQYQTYWTDAKDDEVNLRWIRDFYNAMYGPNGPVPDGIVDGCYVNYPDVDLVNWPYLYYKDNYARLQRAKARWDPLNIFNHQQSIQLPSE